MRIELHKNGLTVTEDMDSILTTKMNKVEKRLKRYHPEVADLEIRLDYFDKLSEFECSLNLKLFKDTLQAKKQGSELRTAVDRSFEVLYRELENYRVKVNKNIQAKA